jgi:hypothetical protein
MAAIGLSFLTPESSEKDPITAAEAIEVLWCGPHPSQP